MRAVVQRVDEAAVIVDDEVIASIGTGLLALIGIHQKDTERDRDYMIEKILKLRIFPDENNNMNKSLQDIEGELLLVSQFALYGDCRKGNRPSFIDAMKPDLARVFYENMVEECQKRYPNTQTGLFAALMRVSLVNNGPVTIILDSERQL